jgi:hypothetical protein
VAPSSCEKLLKHSNKTTGLKVSSSAGSCWTFCAFVSLVLDKVSMFSDAHMGVFGSVPDCLLSTLA